MTKVRHHLLEIILWPNNEGSFKTILNSASKLKDMGIYDAHLTIEMTRSEHGKLHGQYLKGENNPHYGKQHTDVAKRKIASSQQGENNSFYGKTYKHSDEAKLKISEAVKARYAKTRL